MGDFNLRPILYMILIITAIAWVGIPSNKKIDFKEYDVNGTTYLCPKSMTFNPEDKNCTFVRPALIKEN